MSQCKCRGQDRGQLVLFIHPEGPGDQTQVTIHISKHFNPTSLHTDFFLSLSLSLSFSLSLWIRKTNTSALLNFMFCWCYRVTPCMVQLPTPQVSYLELIITLIHKVRTLDRKHLIQSPAVPSTKEEILLILGISFFFMFLGSSLFPLFLLLT